MVTPQLQELPSVFTLPLVFRMILDGQFHSACPGCFFTDQTRMLPIFQGPFPVFGSESISSSFPIWLLPLCLHLRSYS